MKGNVFGCIEHHGRRTREGYSRDGSKGAHVAAWERHRGPVPEGMVLDHLCCNRACVALHHLEPVTQRENLFRRQYDYRVRIKTCPAGHDMTGTNAVTTSHGGRVCRQCNREAKEAG